MEATNWLRQTDEPAFPDLFWSRPENKRQAGKLLIVGGNSHAFSAVSSLFTASEKAGIGTARVILPDSLKKSLAMVLPEALFAPSTPSGSFSRQALAEILDALEWADGLLLAGDFGKNSETAVMLDGLVNKYSGRIVANGDSLDYFTKGELFVRPKTSLVASFGQLQKMAATEGLALKQTSDLLNLVQKLSLWRHPASLMTVFENFTVVSSEGKVSTTPSIGTETELSAYAAVWQIQHPTNDFEALTSAAYALRQQLK